MPHDGRQELNKKSNVNSTSSIHGKSSGRKLVLHFDIRNTLIVADSVTKITVEQAINAYLARVVWGKETSNGSWEWVSKVPSIEKPTKGCMTYYKHLEKKIVRKPVDRVTTLRLALGDLAQKNGGSRFESYHKRALHGLRWKHPVSPESLTVEGTSGLSYHYILPAFYRLLTHLSKTDRDFSIVIRTFGLHCKEVLNSIKHSCEGQHPLFPNLPAVPISLNPGFISRRKDKTTLTFEAGEFREAQEICSEREIYDYLNQSTGISGIIDDFHFWQDNDFYFQCAKPHWVDLSDENTHHIMIDDNYRPLENDSIINMRLIDGETVTDLSKMEGRKLDGACAFTMDLLKCLDNENYFIEKIAECESNYENLLENGL